MAELGFNLGKKLYITHEITHFIYLLEKDEITHIRVRIYSI